MNNISSIAFSPQDAAKVYTFRLLKHFNVFGYNDTGMIITREQLQQISIGDGGGGNGGEGMAVDCSSFIQSAASTMGVGSSSNQGKKGE